MFGIQVLGIQMVTVQDRTVWSSDVSGIQSPGIKIITVIFQDIDEARKVLAEAQSDLSKAGTEVEKAEAQIAIEVAEELVKAIGH